MERKINVVWVCQVSNQQLRHNLSLHFPIWRKIINAIKKEKSTNEIADYAQWNTNAILEFEKIPEVNLHVIFVHPCMKKYVQQFTQNGVHYYAVNSGDTSFVRYLKWHIPHFIPTYERTWKSIALIIKEINPDIVHVMGAENPPYSLSVRYFPSKIPILVQLQTLLNDPNVDILTPNGRAQKLCETEVLKHADYIGSKIPGFANCIRKHIKKDAIIVNTRLLIAENVKNEDIMKKYDFVYFANNISKSIDLAIEAFGIAYKKHPEITLDVVGGATSAEFELLKCRLEEMGCKNAVTFEGKLPTHDDVITQIKKARFALLPLKIDVVSGTIREAMWNRLPVVTTITSGTPSLNKERESVLLSPVGEHETLAANMCRLLEDSSLVVKLKQNALITVEENYGGNEKSAQEWLKVYKACINHYNYNIPIPTELINGN